MHTKSDSEVTSLAASSPPRSPTRSRPLYFVQSPSRDSHDGDSKVSFHSTPLAISPIGSPLHPNATFSRSRDSSQCLLPHSASGRSSVASGPLPTAHRSSLKTSSSSKKHHRYHYKGSSWQKAWAAQNSIQEENLDPFNKPITAAYPQIYSIILVLVSCMVFLFLFILFFWLICRPSHPEISLKSVVFHYFYMGEGTDTSGVPTKMVSVNCSIHVNFHNPSKYFGVHVTPVEAELDYAELSLAKGQISDYFQEKGTHKMISVVVQALKVPIYGAGNGLTNAYDASHGIPLNVVASLYSHYYVVGKMVKPKFVNKVYCSIVLDSLNMALLTSLSSSCTYDPPLTSSHH